jgi:hypothetical protein
MRRPRFHEWYRERTLSSMIGAITPEQWVRRLLRHLRFDRFPRLTDDDDAIVEDGFQVRQSCRPPARSSPATWKRAERLSGVSKSLEPAQPSEQLVRFGAPLVHFSKIAPYVMSLCSVPRRFTGPSLELHQRRMKALGGKAVQQQPVSRLQRRHRHERMFVVHEADIRRIAHQP